MCKCHNAAYLNDYAFVIVPVFFRFFKFSSRNRKIIIIFVFQQMEQICNFNIILFQVYKIRF